jgi:hypothetical protein
MNEINEIYKTDSSSIVDEKLKNALTPGYQVEFDPEEAEEAGAFTEDALNEKDAVESNVDLADALNFKIVQEGAK